MKCFTDIRPRRLVLPGVLVGLVAASTAGAQTAIFAGNQRLGPDQLQTLGVGSRSIAMGNAFSAIADDASATFWNPGRLGFIPKREFMLEYRPVFNTNATTTNNGFSSGYSTGKPQLGFASFVYNLGHDRAVGISYTLGGYISDQLNIMKSSTAADNTFTTVTGKSNLLVRNSFITLAYGQNIPIVTKAKGKSVDGGTLGVGAGVFFVNQEYGGATKITTSLYANQQAYQNGLPSLATSTPANPNVSERGQGVGVNVGLAYDAPKFWHIGLDYRSKTKLSGLQSGQIFNTETPDRIALGVAYGTALKAKSRILVSTEFEVLSAVNRGTVNGVSEQIDRRKAVGNFHFGVEYTPGKLPFDRSGLEYRMPLRMGFRTDKAAATNYTFDDNIVSFGLAFQQLYAPQAGATNLTGERYSIEPTMELFTSNASTQFTITARARF